MLHSLFTQKKSYLFSCISLEINFVLIVLSVYWILRSCSVIFKGLGHVIVIQSTSLGVVFWFVAHQHIFRWIWSHVLESNCLPCVLVHEWRLIQLLLDLWLINIFDFFLLLCSMTAMLHTPHLLVLRSSVGCRECWFVFGTGLQLICTNCTFDFTLVFSFISASFSIHFLFTLSSASVS